MASTARCSINRTVSAAMQALAALALILAIAAGPWATPASAADGARSQIVFNVA